MFENLLKFDFFEIIEVVIRGVLSLIILFLATKMLGKKQVSELSLFDYVIGISIGNFAAEITMNVDNQYINGVFSICDTCVHSCDNYYEKYNFKKIFYRCSHYYYSKWKNNKREYEKS